MLTALISFEVIVLAVMLSTVAAKNEICCTATALSSVAKVAVCAVLSIDAVEKDNHSEGSQISLTYGIYS